MNLLEVCKKVKEDPSKAEELLPTTEGFFFGSTDYNEYYMKDIDYTIEILEEAISEYELEAANKRYNGDYFYSSSW